MPLLSSYRHQWQSIKTVLREQRQCRQYDLLEELSFYVYRSDTNAVLARGILGFEAAKQRADQIRRAKGLPWSLVKFKAEKRTQRPSGAAQGQPAQQRRFGVSADGRTFTNARGETNRVEYSNRYNPSKGRRFRGYTDALGNYHDID
jgi:hypothetical protein